MLYQLLHGRLAPDAPVLLELSPDLVPGGRQGPGVAPEHGLRGALQGLEQGEDALAGHGCVGAKKNIAN